MGLSIAELELQSSECLPAREVMTLLGGRGGGGSTCVVDDADTTTQTSTGLLAVNGDVENPGIGNGNNVCLNDILDINGNDVLNGWLNGNRVGTFEG